MKQLTERLQVVLTRIKPGEPLWDVGCDHGIVGLTAQNLDIPSQLHLVDPTLGSIEKILKNKVNPNITIWLSRGESLPWKDVQGTLIMTGMGYRTIRSVMQSSYGKVKNVRWLLGPQSEESEAEYYFRTWGKVTVFKTQERERIRWIYEVN